MSGVVNRRLRPLLLVAVPGAAVLAALLFWLWGGRYVATENAYVKAHIAQISAEVAGRIHEVHIHDHAEVKAGDVLFTLDQEPFRVALAKAEAELDSIRSQVRTMVATWHEARSELQEAESKVAYWNAQVARQKTLAERGIVSSSKFEEIENNAIAATDRVSVDAQEGRARRHAARAAIPSAPWTSTPWCARSRPSASGPRWTSPAP